MSTNLSPENAAVAARHISGATIAMGDGSYFNYLDPHATTMTIEDYAYALAYTCRFRGQTRSRGVRCFYSVAEHNCRGALDLLENGYGIEAAWGFLGHESDEVPWGDFPGPTKPLMPESFKRLVKDSGAGIDAHFGFYIADRDLNKRQDLRMLATEKRDLMRHVQEDWHGDDGHGPVLSGFEPLAKEIRPLAHPDLAAKWFIRLHRELSQRLANEVQR